MPYTDESDFKYVQSLDDVPVTGGIGKSWETEDIFEAVETGEQKLEGDVNEGQPIPQSEVVPLHGEAAATWATYRLVVGMKSPDSATRGDSLDEGDQRMEFAQELKSMYRSHKKTINEAEGFSSAQDEDSVDFRVANWNDNN